MFTNKLWRDHDGLVHYLYRRTLGDHRGGTVWWDPACDLITNRNRAKRAWRWQINEYATCWACMWHKRRWEKAKF